MGAGDRHGAHAPDREDTLLTPEGLHARLDHVGLVALAVAQVHDLLVRAGARFATSRVEAGHVLELAGSRRDLADRAGSSPAWMPALASGRPGDGGDERPRRCRPSGPRGARSRPATRAGSPASTARRRTSCARLEGIAKPMPPPPSSLMPTTSPLRLTSGPPLLPGWMSASCWIQRVKRPVGCPSSRSSSACDAPVKLVNTRLVFATMPSVSELLRPRGFPIAITGSPTSRASESPSTANGIGVPGVLALVQT